MESSEELVEEEWANLFLTNGGEIIKGATRSYPRVVWQEEMDTYRVSGQVKPEDELTGLYRIVEWDDGEFACEQCDEYDAMGQARWLDCKMDAIIFDLVLRSITGGQFYGKRFT